MSLERYRAKAEEIVEDHGLGGHHGMGDLIRSIQQAIQLFVEHDLEWAAVAVEAFTRDNALGLSHTAERRLFALAQSIRERGRE